MTTPEQVIQIIAQAAEGLAFQAGVGAMETAGSIISFLAANPDRIQAFIEGREGLSDWPIGWHMHGCLTWHGMNGKIVHPTYARRAQLIKNMERGE